jgi:Peptidase of plants and bacteria
MFVRRIPWFSPLVVVLTIVGYPTLLQAQATPERKPAVNVIIDVSDAPDAEEWAKKAKGVVETWHPRVAKMLKTEGHTPPDEVKLVFKSDMKGVAHSTGNSIVISNDWIKKHPEDLGMVVHELTHVIQHYPHSRVNNGWLVEGIADYIRFFHYEPGPSIGRFNPAKAKYTDSYRTTARFLAWIEKTHDKTIVATLNKACRQGKYQPEIFKKATSKTLDELWEKFIAEAKKADKGKNQ